MNAERNVPMDEQQFSEVEVEQVSLTWNFRKVYGI